jgi:Helicase conserved C-terminal domain
VKILSDDELLELLGPEPEQAPWRHQAKEFDEHKDTKCRALLWSMRTGKSRSVIDKAEYQYQQRNIEGVIVLAPNGIHLNYVINEIPRWSWPENRYMAFGWETPKRADWDRIAQLKEFEEYSGGLRYLTINMEAIGHMECIEAIRRFKKSCHGKFMLVISEAHHFGHASAKRTKLARNLGRKAAYITLETGTPILNSPLRAYSIYKILDDFALGPEFAGAGYDKFFRRYAVMEAELPARISHIAKHRAYKKKTGYKNLDELQAKMAPWSSVVLRSDIEDMPGLLRTDRIVVMSEKQRRAYLEMVSRHLLEIGDKQVSAIDGGARVQKLQQIVNGYIKDGNNIIEIDANAPIYDALLEEIGGTLPGKSIIWCRYREDIRRVCARLRGAGYQVLEFHGGVPTSKREPTRLAFQNDPRYTVLVGHPGAGGEGRDFSAADTVIFFSSTPNAIHVTQGEERATLVAGHPVNIVRIRTRGTVDDRNWDIVDGKIIVADDLSGRGLRDLLMRTNV